MMEDTLAAVPKEWTSTADIVATLDNPWNFRVTAFNNRLTGLMRFGLIESQKRGRALYWRRKAKSRAA